jgi:hypothetical protein
MQRAQRKWFFALALRGRQSKSLHLFEAKRFVQISAGGREGAFDFGWELDTIWFGKSIIFLMKSSVINEHIDFQGVLL